MRILLSLSLLSCLFSCQPAPQQASDGETPIEYHLIGGKTMGTSYSIKFKGGEAGDINDALDSLFRAINQEVSTYIPESAISQFNADKTVGRPLNYLADKAHFMANFRAAQKVYEDTKGRFDPTVMPLVNYWGFGYKGEPVTKVDEGRVQSLMAFVGMDKITLNEDGHLQKATADVELDFSAIAKGYGVDQAGRLLEQRGIADYLVEIGGEVYTKGQNPQGKPFVIGINKPVEEAPIRDFTAYVGLSGKGMATSGNYRNYYLVGNEKYSHTISPQTGFPERSKLLSATVVAPDCMTADAHATACMVMGLPEAHSHITAQPDLEGYFIFINDKGDLEAMMTEGFETMMLDMNHEK